MFSAGNIIPLIFTISTKILHKIKEIPEGHKKNKKISKKGLIFSEAYNIISFVASDK